MWLDGAVLVMFTRRKMCMSNITYSHTENVCRLVQLISYVTCSPYRRNKSNGETVAVKVINLEVKLWRFEHSVEL